VSAVLRVMVHEAWDEVVLPWRADATVVEVKRAALETTRVAGAPEEFVVKFNGAQLLDEEVTIGATGVPENGALIVLRQHRRPVR
jgi:hypothetical protein